MANDLNPNEVMLRVDQSSCEGERGTALPMNGEERGKGGRSCTGGRGVISRFIPTPIGGRKVGERLRGVRGGGGEDVGKQRFMGLR